MRRQRSTMRATLAGTHGATVRTSRGGLVQMATSSWPSVS